MSTHHRSHQGFHFEKPDVEAIKASLSYSGADVYADYAPRAPGQPRLDYRWASQATESDLRRQGLLPDCTITNNHANNSHHQKSHGHHHKTILNDRETIGNAKLVGHVARKYGVDPATAVAAMLVESEGKHHAVGDHGKSFGLFQLHRGGLLTTAHLTASQAFNPYTNASVALKHMRKTMDTHQYSCPGQLVAASQGPAHKHLYAKKVNAMLPVARQILAMN